MKNVIQGARHSKRNGSDKGYPPAFVTYGWCRSAYAVVQSLGMNGVPVHVGDPSGLAMCRFSRFTRSFSRLPDFYAEPERYFDELCAALKRTGAKVLLPAHEDIGLVIRWRSGLPQGVSVCLPELSTWEEAEDKAAYVERVRAAGCPTPTIHSVGSEPELDTLLATLPMPLVIKTRSGSSAKGVRICHSERECREQFLELVKQFNLPPDRWPILQEYISGEKIGVVGFFSNGLNVSSLVYKIVRSKASSNFGTATYRVVIDEPTILADAVRALEALQWNGVYDMDWLRDESGQARLIDINGRIGGSTVLTVASGMEMPFLWYLEALGRLPAAVPPIRIGTRARWILGDGLGFISSAAKGRWRECLDILTPRLGCAHDDFKLSDPLPFIFQGLDYLGKFVRAGGSMNPVSAGMIR